MSLTDNAHPVTLTLPRWQMNRIIAVLATVGGSGPDRGVTDVALNAAIEAVGARNYREWKTGNEWLMRRLHGSLGWEDC